MEQTGQKYTVARRAVIAGRDPGQPPVVLRVYLKPHVDLELAGEAGLAYAAADEPGRREMASRLLADHIELAGAGEAGVAAGSEIMTVQALRVEEIGEVVRRRIGRAAGVSAVAAGGDLDRVQVNIEAARPAWCPAMAARRPGGLYQPGPGGAGQHRRHQRRPHGTHAGVRPGAGGGLADLENSRQRTAKGHLDRAKTGEKHSDRHRIAPPQ